jgi:hypothetical protein
MMQLSTLIAIAAAATLLAMHSPPREASADIFLWEYINPNDPTQGTQPSTTLAPDGAGAHLLAGADLSNRNLEMAYLVGANLSGYIVYDSQGLGIGIAGANLTGANLGQADLRACSTLSCRN